ncbi:hypothetical protein BGZ58_004688 [Dissophora ornata]|nr:hypothetical protein BGZ58_004688 [Dissophora ornata]
MTQTMDPSSDQQLFKVEVESPQRGVCPGELLPLSLAITNSSDTELQSIHLSLVRVVSYPTAFASSSSPLSSPSSTNNFTPAEPTTVHSVTIRVSKTLNKKSTWQEAIQLKIPTSLGLIPTTNKAITPLFKVDYYLSISLPVASRSAGLASWFTLSTKSAPPVDISLIRDAAGTSEASSEVAVENIPSNSHTRPRKISVDKTTKTNLNVDKISTLNSTMKWPTLIQLPLVPVIIGTVPYCITERRLRWPIPNYLDVMDRPCFIRDRFEEEMMQHFQSLETLIAEEDDEDHIESIIEAARKSLSSGESDEDEQRIRSKIPARFRDDGGSKNRRIGNSSSIAPSASPPSPPAMVMMHHTLPRMGHRSKSPKSRGLSKEVLLEMHHSKIQQNIHAEFENI